MCEMVCYGDATANSFVAKFLGKVLAHFHKVAVKHDDDYGAVGGMSDKSNRIPAENLP
jgi:hypothetical protein